MIQTQTAAETSVSQIQVTMPICGRVLRFDSPLQVEPGAEMAVAFTSRRQHLAGIDPSLWHAVGLFVALLIAGAVVRWLARPWAWLCTAASPLARAPSPCRAGKPSASDDRADRARSPTDELSERSLKAWPAR
jgi:hypothetical protein